MLALLLFTQGTLATRPAWVFPFPDVYGVDIESLEPKCQVTIVRGAGPPWIPSTSDTGQCWLEVPIEIRDRKERWNPRTMFVPLIARRQRGLELASSGLARSPQAILGVQVSDLSKVPLHLAMSYPRALAAPVSKDKDAIVGLASIDLLDAKLEPSGKPLQWTIDRWIDLIEKGKPAQVIESAKQLAHVNGLDTGVDWGFFSGGPWVAHLQGAPARRLRTIAKGAKTKRALLIYAVLSRWEIPGLGDEIMERLVSLGKQSSEEGFENSKDFQTACEFLVGGEVAPGVWATALKGDIPVWVRSLLLRNSRRRCPSRNGVTFSKTTGSRLRRHSLPR